MGSAADLVHDLVEDVRAATLPQADSTLLRVCDRVQDGCHLLRYDFVHQRVGRLRAFEKLSTSGQDLIIEDSDDSV